MTLILLAAGGTGLSAYASSRRALASLWQNLSGSVADSITQRSLRYLEPAVPYMGMTDRLAKDRKIDPDDRMAILDYFKAGLTANPEFTWASYGDETGSYLAAYRTPNGEVHGTWRDQVTDAKGAKSTLWRDFRAGSDGKWKPYREKRELYDPRLRKWYQDAAKTEGRGVWGEPFLFTSRKQPGFIYSRRYMRDGKLHGVWAVQWEVQPGLVPEGDSTLLLQVFEQLLGDAWKFSNQQAHTRIAFSCSASPDARLCTPCKTTASVLTWPTHRSFWAHFSVCTPRRNLPAPGWASSPCR